jgi:pyrroloquinoline quinone (PQQ) biosynthesis protein C
MTSDGVRPDSRTFADALLEYLEPYRQAVLDCSMIQDCKRGTLSLKHIRSWVAQQYDYVHSFPAWFGLLLRKVDDPLCREALMRNIFEERAHPKLWFQFTRGWGLSDEEVQATELCPEMQALNDYLWRITHDGHIVEAGSALCVALEGMSKTVIDEIGPSLYQHYHGRNGVKLDNFALMWLKTHATVDVEHGRDGAVLVNCYATTPELQGWAKFAGRRALEFLRLGFDGVWRRSAE